MCQTSKGSTYKTFSDYAVALQKEQRLSSLAAAEKAAENFGFILLPATCLSWRKRATLGESRRIKINESFYAVTLHELTDLERNKFFKYLDNMAVMYR